jgi:superfamily II DNA helicase RecQ
MIGKSKCICFCLTVKNCINFKELLSRKGLSVEAFYSNSPNNDDDIISGFNGNKIQVICATKALGRGVHISCPVRFVIHTSMPLSLTGTF